MALGPCSLRPGHRLMCGVPRPRGPRGPRRVGRHQRHAAARVARPLAGHDGCGCPRQPSTRPNDFPARPMRCQKLHRSSLQPYPPQKGPGSGSLFSSPLILTHIGLFFFNSGPAHPSTPHTFSKQVNAWWDQSQKFAPRPPGSGHILSHLDEFAFCSVSGIF